MPYQIKNGIIYSGNAVTLTQAQYDALTTAEKNNGTVYYIYDSDAMIEAQEVGLDGGNVETLAGSVATFESSPSTAVHAEGEYILYQAQLYKVTSAIAVGEDLTVGSNIEATNLGNELNNGSMVFPNYSDVIVSQLQINSGTTIYTATRPCLAFLSPIWAGSERKYYHIKVNGNRIGDISPRSANDAEAQIIPLFLNTGDVVTTSDAMSSGKWWIVLNVFGLHVVG